MRKWDGGGSVQSGHEENRLLRKQFGGEEGAFPNDTHVLLHSVRRDKYAVFLEEDLTNRA